MLKLAKHETTQKTTVQFQTNVQHRTASSNSQHMQKATSLSSLFSSMQLLLPCYVHICTPQQKFLDRTGAKDNVGRPGDFASYINPYKSFIPEAMSSAAHPRCGCASGTPTGSKRQYNHQLKRESKGGKTLEMPRTSKNQGGSRFFLGTWEDFAVNTWIIHATDMRVWAYWSDSRWISLHGPVSHTMLRNANSRGILQTALVTCPEWWGLWWIPPMIPKMWQNAETDPTSRSIWSCHRLLKYYFWLFGLDYDMLTHVCLICIVYRQNKALVSELTDNTQFSACCWRLSVKSRSLITHDIRNWQWNTGETTIWSTSTMHGWDKFSFTSVTVTNPSNQRTQMKPVLPPCHHWSPNDSLATCCINPNEIQRLWTLADLLLHTNCCMVMWRPCRKTVLEKHGNTLRLSCSRVAFWAFLLPHTACHIEEVSQQSLLREGSKIVVPTFFPRSRNPNAQPKSAGSFQSIASGDIMLQYENHSHKK